MHKYGLFFALIFGLLACKTVTNAPRAEALGYIKMTHKIMADSSASAIIQPYKVDMEKLMNKIIGVFTVDMCKKQPEGPLGNFMADALLKMAEKIYSLPVDVATLNNGGIRLACVSKGSITVGKIFELMPFDNALTVLTLSREKTQQLFDKMAEKGGWPISKNTSYTIQNGKAQNIVINGKPLYSYEKVVVAISDYIANGGDDCNFLIGCNRFDSVNMIIELLVDYVKLQTANQQNIESTIEGRCKELK